MTLISRSDALRTNLTKYFTGKPCKNGHISERYVQSGACQECINGVRKTKIKNESFKGWEVVEGFTTVPLTIAPVDVDTMKGLLMAYLMPYAGVVTLDHVWPRAPRHGYVYDVKCPADNVKELCDTAKALYAQRVADVESARDRILGSVLQDAAVPREESVEDIKK